jgi:predicted nucleic acid-binding protein
VLARIELIRISDRLLTEAGTLLPAELRSLDAIHLATAGALGAAVVRLVVYDTRLAAAAEAMGFTVVAPA